MKGYCLYLLFALCLQHLWIWMLLLPGLFCHYFSTCPNLCVSRLIDVSTVFLSFYYLDQHGSFSSSGPKHKYSGCQVFKGKFKMQTHLVENHFYIKITVQTLKLLLLCSFKVGLLCQYAASPFCINRHHTHFGDLSWQLLVTLRLLQETKSGTIILYACVFYAHQLFSRPSTSGFIHQYCSDRNVHLTWHACYTSPLVPECL